MFDFIKSTFYTWMQTFEANLNELKLCTLSKAYFLVNVLMTDFFIVLKRYHDPS